MIAKKNEQRSNKQTGSLLHGSLAEHPPGHNRKLVAFLREDTDSMPLEQQRALIQMYCAEHDMEVVEQVIDLGVTHEALQVSLQEAKNLLAKADGIIVSDINRLVEHQERGYDLRPFLHSFITGNQRKRFIAVAEGIDTRTATGQEAALELINQIKDAGWHEDWVPDTQKVIRGY